MGPNIVALSNDCQETGSRLQRSWLIAAARFDEFLGQAITNFRLPPELELLKAIYLCTRGKPSSLIEHLRSERPLSEIDREYLAQYFEGALDQTPKRGRPRLLEARTAAFEAGAFYDAWRKENKCRRVADHGQARAMKQEAVRFVLEELEPKALSMDAVLELLDRPKHRRSAPR